jgi:hypothetical protein
MDSKIRIYIVDRFKVVKNRVKVIFVDETLIHSDRWPELLAIMDSI